MHSLGSSLDFSTQIYRPDALAQQPWLASLASMVNEAFTQSRTKANHGIFLPNDARLSEKDQLPKELGSDGFCCVAFAEPPKSSLQSLSEDELKNRGPGETIVVGTASLKPYVKSNTRDPVLKLDAGEVPKEWEVVVVSVRPESWCSQKGIVPAMIRVLQAELFRVLEKLTGKDPVALELDGYKLVIKTVGVDKGEYWQRRGFTLTEKMWQTDGTWNSVKGFWLWELKRPVEVGMFN